MTALAELLYRSLRDRVEYDTVFDDGRGCFCTSEQLISERHTPGRRLPCRYCLQVRAREVLAEYEAGACRDCNGTGADPNHTWGDGDLPCPEIMKDVRPDCESCGGTGLTEAAFQANIPPCDDCGRPSPDTATIKFAFDGERAAQCRACYRAMRAREMAGVTA